MKTYMAKKEEMNNSREGKWFYVDATNMVLGRLASEVASRLRGKHKPEYTPHVDCGDQIIVINADKVVVTGNKRTDKIYYSHSGYPGGLKQVPFDKLVEKKPTMPLQKAIIGMLPKGPLGRDMARKLKIYSSSDVDALEKHKAQQPVEITFEQHKIEE
jgi:large subunit ribosomal protein L13